ncbi:MAG: DDE-type integrase/transposase/recombinase [Polyangiaceae bacterium]|nr:DDE-type integrase/transposase/recombinase [Polyangiaceae bacterium]
MWAGDITYLYTAQGWSYLAVIFDLNARRVAGWAVVDHIRTDLPMLALTWALEARRPSPGPICHSDRGSRYASNAHRQTLRQHDVAQSMSRPGDYCDNAFATHTQVYDTVADCGDSKLSPLAAFDEVRLLRAQLPARSEELGEPEVVAALLPRQG